MNHSASRIILIAIGLWVATLVLFWPATGCEFLKYDDQDYVTQNAHVQAGLTGSGIAWALSSAHAANWHPVTWLSHMLDWQMFGSDPAGHHLSNIVVHAMNASLLFLLLIRATGSRWRSALVAAVFAFHPLRVESVVWVSERKDVLSLFFALLTLIAYTEFTRLKSPALNSANRPPRLNRPQSQSRAQSWLVAPSSNLLPGIWYLLALTFFSLGLMSKPMLVTLPGLLLLWDYWPLQRLGAPSGTALLRWRLLAEKLPFLILSAVSCAITLKVQQAATLHLAALPISARTGNAAISYWRYIGKGFWPFDLALPYPHPGHWALGLVVAAGLGLLAVTIWIGRSAHQKSFVLVGWLWFLVSLVPVIGLVQVGAQAMADRYTYLPMIGLTLALVWLAGDWLSQQKVHQQVIMALAGLVLAALAVRTRAQIEVWKNTESLFTHAVRATSNNWVAHYNLALLAMDRYQQRRQPDGPQVPLAIGMTRPGGPARDYLAEVILHCEAALLVRPGFADLHVTLAKALIERGQISQAKGHFERATTLAPGNAEAQAGLAEVWQREGDGRAAVAHYELALELRPDWHEVLNNLAWLRATSRDDSVRDGGKARQLAMRACDLTGRTNFSYLQTLAAAQAEAGDFPGALTTTARARELAEQANLPAWRERVEARERLFNSGKAVRE